ncbi:phytosulfokine peptide [Musa troglodytarum]|uniref:Phytosulfokine n=1 Tax=Musa troglodytarum TaxID=320322 RepID=A0A9E7I6W9_9LILI|nr:phytosulfokine peptide [Musa troglodytarum]
MRRSSQFPLVFLLLVIILSTPTATVASRFLRPPRQELVKLHGLQGLEHAEGPEEEDAWNLIGTEECQDGNEECLKRRTMTEAHLDYIYTQHHPKP